MMAYLTKEQRKQEFEHGSGVFNFASCADLSRPIKVTICNGSAKELAAAKPELFALEVGAFIGWWTMAFYRDLNGFPGLNSLRYEFA